MRRNTQLVFNSLTAQLIIILIRLSIDSILYNIMNTLGIENDLKVFITLVANSLYVFCTIYPLIA